MHVPLALAWAVEPADHRATDNLLRDGRYLVFSRGVGHTLMKTPPSPMGTTQHPSDCIWDKSLEPMVIRVIFAKGMGFMAIKLSLCVGEW